MCITHPPPGIDYYLTVIHLLETLAHRYGLFPWEGSSLFEMYPILGRIAWENMENLKKQPLELGSLAAFRGARLYRGKFNGTSGIFSLPNSSPIEKDLDGERIRLGTDLIAVGQGNEIADILPLPPYWKSEYDDNFIPEAEEFHQTSLG